MYLTWLWIPHQRPGTSYVIALTQKNKCWILTAVMNFSAMLSGLANSHPLSDEWMQVLMQHWLRKVADKALKGYFTWCALDTESLVSKPHCCLRRDLETCIVNAEFPIASYSWLPITQNYTVFLWRINAGTQCDLSISTKTMVSVQIDSLPLVRRDPANIHLGFIVLKHHYSFSSLQPYNLFGMTVWIMCSF